MRSFFKKVDYYISVTMRPSPCKLSVKQFDKEMEKEKKARHVLAFNLFLAPPCKDSDLTRNQGPRRALPLFLRSFLSSIKQRVAIIPKNWKSYFKQKEWRMRLAIQKNETSLVNKSFSNLGSCRKKLSCSEIPSCNVFHSTMLSWKYSVLILSLVCTYLVSFPLATVSDFWQLCLWNDEARAFYSHFTREKIYLRRQNISEFSLFLTIQNAERSKPSQIFSYHVSFWTTYKSTRSDAIPSISKTVVIVAMLVLLLHSYKRRILSMEDLRILI